MSVYTECAGSCLPVGLSGGDAPAPKELPVLPEPGRVWKHAGSY